MQDDPTSDTAAVLSGRGNPPPPSLDTDPRREVHHHVADQPVTPRFALDVPEPRLLSGRGCEDRMPVLWRDRPSPLQLKCQLPR